MASRNSSKPVPVTNRTEAGPIELPFVMRPCLCSEHQVANLLVYAGDKFVPSFQRRTKGLITIGDDPPSPSLGPTHFPNLTSALSEAQAIVVWVGGFDRLIRFSIDLMGMRWRTVEIQTQAEASADWERLLPHGTPCFRILPRSDWDFVNPEGHYPDLTNSFSSAFAQLAEKWPESRGHLS